MARRRAEFLVALVFAGLAGAFLWEVLLGGKVLLPLDNLFLFPPWRAFAAQFGASVPNNHLIGDLLVQNISWRTFAQDVVRQGSLPLWNPFVFAGTPFLAAGQQAVLYPFGAMFYILAVPQAYGWYTALHLLLGMLGMYAFVRATGVPRFGGIVAAITFAFSGFMVVSFLWPMVVGVAVWVPYLLLLVELVIKQAEGPVLRPGRQALWGLLLAVAVGLMFLAGHLEFAFYGLFTAGFYACCRLVVLGWIVRRVRPVLRAAMLLLVGVMLGTSLAAVQLVPFGEIAGQNFRTGLVGYDDVVGYALPKWQVLSFVMPDFFGNPTHHSYFDVVDGKTKPVGDNALGQPTDPPQTIFWGRKNYVEAASYVGILPLLLAALAVIGRRNRYTWIFLLYGVFSLSLAFGAPWYRLFFYGVPGFDQLHSPFRWIFPYTLSVAALAGIGASYVADGGARKRLPVTARGRADESSVILSPSKKDEESTSQGRDSSSFLEGLRMTGGSSLVGLAATALGLLVVVGLGASLVFQSKALGLARRLFERLDPAKQAFADAQMFYSYEFRNLLLFGVLLAASGAVVLLARSGRRFGLPFPAWQGFAVVVLVFDLFFVGMGFNSKTDPALLQFVPPSVEVMTKDPELFRVAGFGDEDVLPPNTGIRLGLQDIRGYDSTIPQQFVDYWGLIEKPHGLLYNRIHKLTEPASLSSPFLDLLNVKYILTTKELDLPTGYKGEMNVYLNPDYLPRAFLVFQAEAASGKAEALAKLREPGFDPRRRVVLEGTDGGPSAGRTTDVPAFGGGELVPARVTSYTANQVVVEAQAPATGVLVLADSYFPGWRATVDGRDAPIYRADYNFRAVILEPGAHTVTFKYSPLSFRMGLLLSFVALLALAVGFVYAAWRRLYTEGAPTAQRVAKNTLTPMTSSLLNKAVDLGFAMLMLRMLGPAGIGQYTFAIALVTYFDIFTNFGLSTLLTREVAKDPQAGNRYLNHAMLLRAGLWLAAMPLLALVVFIWGSFWGLEQDVVIAIALLALALVPGNIAAAFSSMFYAHEKIEYPAGVTVFSTVVKVALGIAALSAGYGIVGLGAVAVVVNVFTALVLAYLVVSRLLRPHLELDGGFSLSVLSASWPLMLNNLLATAFFRADVLIMKASRDSSEVGYYGTAYKFIDGLNIIPSTFTLAIFPLMSRYAASAREALARAYTLALKALLIVSVPFAVGTTLLADELVLLVGGPDYLPHSATALRILIWFLPFSYVNSVTQYVLIAVERQRFLTAAFVAGASFNIVANLILIPRIGYSGAAITTILSELVLMVPFGYAVRRDLGTFPVLSLMWRPAVAAAVMGGIMLLLHGLNPLLLVPLAIAAYFGMLLPLQAFTAEEWQLVRGMLRRKARQSAP